MLTNAIMTIFHSFFTLRHLRKSSFFLRHWLQWSIPGEILPLLYQKGSLYHFYFRMQHLVILGILSISALCTAYPSFQTSIPNGDSVPHPCNSELWPGVGHHNYRGGGDRNPFGVDFKANNFVSTIISYWLNNTK